MALYIDAGQPRPGPIDKTFSLPPTSSEPRQICLVGRSAEGQQQRMREFEDALVLLLLLIGGSALGIAAWPALSKRDRSMGLRLLTSLVKASSEVVDSGSRGFAVEPGQFARLEGDLQGFQLADPFSGVFMVSSGRLRNSLVEIS